VKGSNLEERFDAIDLGSVADDFVRYTMDLLAEGGVELALCEDAYSAVATLARNGKGGDGCFTWGLDK